MYAHSIAIPNAEGLVLACAVARVRTLVVLDIARTNKRAAEAVEVAVPFNGKLVTVSSDLRSSHTTKSGGEGLQVTASRASPV